jgi:branched-chain amino acid transport system permease protein
MVIVGGLGSVIGIWMGAEFILLLPGQIHALIAWLAGRAGVSLGIETMAHVPYAVYGALIIGFLLVEPMGLGKLYGNVRNYLLVWPFGYARR